MRYLAPARFGLRRRARLIDTPLQQQTRIDPEKHRDENDDDRADAAAGDASRDPHAAAVFNIPAFFFLIQTHGTPPEDRLIALPSLRSDEA